MRNNLSLLSLMGANLYPIYGVLYLNWDLSGILFLYWFENIVIGFYNVLKMIKAEKPNMGGITVTVRGNSSVDKSKKGTVFFFILHYGMFTFVHGVFLIFMLVRNLHIDLSLLIGIGFMFLSHGVSYVKNYIGGDEYKNQSPEDLMGAPYKRIIVMHMTIVLGGFAILNINGQSIVPLVVMTIVKLIIDIFSHILEHNRLVPIGPSDPKNGVYFIKTSMINKISPNYKNIAAEAYRQSVISGKWNAMKAQMDPNIAAYIENYWLKNKGIESTTQTKDSSGVNGSI